MLSGISKLVGSVLGGPTASPSDYAPEVIDAMAEQMPPREGVWWAVLSGKDVVSDLTPEDIAAMEAAEAWVIEPSEATAEAVEEALKDVDYHGPGAWAAVAVMSAPMVTAVASGASGAGLALGAAPIAGAAASAIAPKAVAGAVKIAAAIASGNKPQPLSPEEAAEAVNALADAAEAADAAGTASQAAEVVSAADTAKTAKALKPFIDLGKDIMEGTKTWN